MPYRVLRFEIFTKKADIWGVCSLIQYIMTDKQLAIYLSRHLAKLRDAIQQLENEGGNTSAFDEVAADLIDDIETLTKQE